MTRKIIYGIVSVIIVFLFVLLLNLKFAVEPVFEEKQTAQTIIPAAALQTENSKSSAKISKTEEAQIFIELYKDETFLEVFSVDLNSDGREDQVVVVKKLLDPFIYLILSIPDNKTGHFVRAAEIRTGVTQAKSLSFYTVEQEDSSPAVIYSGMGSDNSQLLAIYAASENENGVFSLSEIINLHADVQIQFNNKKNSGRGKLSDYEICSYDSDPASPDTLAQIKRIYQWSKKTNSYVKIHESKIPGEKIEMQLLRKLQNGNMESFKEFLSGLWYQPNSSGTKIRYLYFGNAENTLIFHIDNIEEIYTIKSVLPRRYGIFFVTSNKSIPSIHIKVNIELKGVDEIYVNVIEDVARLKIHTASNWDGIYRKKNDAALQADNSPSAQKIANIEKIFSGKTFFEDSSQTGFFKTEKNFYELKIDGKIEKGRFNLCKMNNDILLQLKNAEGETFFFMMDTDNTGKVQTLKLTGVTVLLDKITTHGSAPLIFNRKIDEKEISRSAES